MKKLAIILLLGLFMFVTACGQDASKDNSGVSKDEADFIVGVLQYVEHPSLDQATEGFKAAIEEAGLKVHFDNENAQGDAKNNSAIADKFAGDKVDLIFANATPSAQAALNETEEIPIVFTSVTDPVGAELVASMKQPGGNVTGTSDSNPEAIPSTLQLIKDMGFESVGTVYNAGEQNSVTQVDQLKEAASELGLTVEDATVSTSAEVKQAAESLVGKVDVFYIITDNTVVSSLESVILVSEKEKLPLFVGELDSVKRGGFAAYGFSYYDIGYEAGEKAVQILKGEAEPGEIPATFPQNLVLEINTDAAENMGVELTDELKEKATLVETQQQEE
jgi:putative tryptophan/tyrosine transport system substrate-binding protein